MRFASAGVELAAAVGGGCLLGYWIDLRFATRPWGLLICAAIGVVGGLYNLVRQASRDLVRTAEDERARRAKRSTDEADP
jgi:F0F1-type ATP synthase assembly protein I